MNAIELKNVSKTIDKNKILDNISFSIEEKTIFGIIGPNGSGKSTLLKMMVGLYKYNEGSIVINGYELKDNFEKVMQQVGSVIETPDLYKGFTGLENLEIFRSLFKDVEESRIKDIVRIVNLEKVIGKKIKTYSLGMKQRLGLAQALINNPKILILDEPTNGLDPAGIRDLRDLLLSLKNTTVIISSHILSEIEAICDKVMFLKSGKIVSIKDLKEGDKKFVKFEVNNKNKVRELYNISEDLKVYASNNEINNMVKTLVTNDIEIYRIYESKTSLEDEYIDKFGDAHES